MFCTSARGKYSQAVTAWGPLTCALQLILLLWISLRFTTAFCVSRAAAAAAAALPSGQKQ